MATPPTKPPAQSHPNPLTAQIEAFVSRHQAVTDELEDIHLDACIEEAQAHPQRRTLSPFLPTTSVDLATIFEALDIGPRCVLVDLGCGDGRPLIAGALLRGCRGVGVDISWQCIWLAKTIMAGEGLLEGTLDFFTLDLLEDQNEALDLLVAAVEAQATEIDAGAVIIFLYVYPTLLARLVELVRRLASACQGEGGQRMVQVVTLTYHFAGPLVEAAEWTQVCEGRFQVHTLKEREE